MGQEIFYSKIDSFILVVIGMAWVLTAGVLYLVYRQVTSKLLVLLITLPTTLLLFPLPIWILLTTQYTIEGSMLNVRSGPVDVDIDISTIESVTPTRNARSSPALSLDRLEIVYGDGERVLVSPEEASLFRQRIDEIKGNGNAAALR